MLAEGTTLDGLATQLADAHVIAHPSAFEVYARLLGAGDRLRTGEIILADDMTPRTILMRVAEGMGRPLVDVMIPEGLTRFEVAARLEHWGICERAAFLDASASAELGTSRKPGTMGGADGAADCPQPSVARRSAASSTSTSRRTA